mmetsp:Transcript_114064/g.219494  ORF Transcript_114064/g.219494 Transcript_114064/m.219494 type:complete len:123 (+) Transcript_114064:225-593(+)
MMHAQLQVPSGSSCLEQSCPFANIQLQKAQLNPKHVELVGQSVYVAVVVEVVVGTSEPTSDSNLRSAAKPVAFFAMSLVEILLSRTAKDARFKFSRTLGSIEVGTVILQTTFTMPRSRRPPP